MFHSMSRIIIAPRRQRAIFMHIAVAKGPEAADGVVQLSSIDIENAQFLIGPASGYQIRSISSFIEKADAVDAAVVDVLAPEVADHAVEIGAPFRVLAPVFEAGHFPDV